MKKRSPTRPAGGPRQKRKAATTVDILGPKLQAPRIAPKWKRQYERLRDLRDHLANNKGLLAEDARQEVPTFSMHMADAGTDTYGRDWALSMLSSEQNARNFKSSGTFLDLDWNKDGPEILFRHIYKDGQLFESHVFVDRGFYLKGAENMMPNIEAFWDSTYEKIVDLIGKQEK